MNQVTVICKEKKRRRRYSSMKAAMDALRWWVVLDEAERKFTQFIFGEDVVTQPK